MNMYMKINVQFFNCFLILHLYIELLELIGVIYN